MEDFSIKTFVKRNARTSERQKKAYEELFSVYCVNLETCEKIDFQALFNNTNETIIEIGFGSGDATAKIALDNPNTNYLAIDVFQTGVAKLISKISENNIKNIRIIEYDAVEVLQKKINSNSVKGFHIFFPDPWPKKRHHKRRLMKSDKIKLMTEKLILGGFIYFVTDWEEYALDAIEELKQNTALKNRYENFAPKQEWRPQTNFEKKALTAGRNIFELIFEKK